MTQQQPAPMRQNVEHVIVFAGASAEQGPSMLRWADDGREVFFTVIEANGDWFSLTVRGRGMLEVDDDDEECEP